MPIIRILIHVIPQYIRNQFIIDPKQQQNTFVNFSQKQIQHQNPQMNRQGQNSKSKRNNQRQSQRRNQQSRSQRDMYRQVQYQLRQDRNNNQAVFRDGEEAIQEEQYIGDRTNNFQQRRLPEFQRQNLLIQLEKNPNKFYDIRILNNNALQAQLNQGNTQQNLSTVQKPNFTPYQTQKQIVWQKIIINAVVWDKHVNGLFDYQQKTKLVKSMIMIDQHQAKSCINFINQTLSPPKQTDVYLIIYKNKNNKNLTHEVSTLKNINVKKLILEAIASSSLGFSNQRVHGHINMEQKNNQNQNNLEFVQIVSKTLENRKVAQQQQRERQEDVKVNSDKRQKVSQNMLVPQISGFEERFYKQQQINQQDDHNDQLQYKTDSQVLCFLKLVMNHQTKQFSVKVLSLEQIHKIKSSLQTDKQIKQKVHQLQINQEHVNLNESFQTIWTRIQNRYNEVRQKICRPEGNVNIQASQKKIKTAEKQEKNKSSHQFSKPYFIVRSLYHKSYQNQPHLAKGYRLSPGDLIKLGKVQFRVMSVDGQNIQDDPNNQFDRRAIEVTQIEEELLKQIQCKYCLGGITEDNQDNFFVHLCDCKGHIGYVHYQCLTTWTTTKASIETSDHVKMYFLEKMKCQVCTKQFPKYFRYKQKIYHLLPIDLPQKHLLLVDVSQKQDAITAVINGQSLKEHQQVLIGRSRNSELRISDITVSRQHSKISRFEDSYYIKDCKSKFGTIVRSSVEQLDIDLQRKKGFQINNTIFTVQVVKKQLQVDRQSSRVPIQEQVKQKQKLNQMPKVNSQNSILNSSLIYSVQNNQWNLYNFTNNKQQKTKNPLTQQNKHQQIKQQSNQNQQNQQKIQLQRSIDQIKKQLDQKKKKSQKQILQIFKRAFDSNEQVQQKQNSQANQEEKEYIKQQQSLTIKQTTKKIDQTKLKNKKSLKISFEDFNQKIQQEKRQQENEFIMKRQQNLRQNYDEQEGRTTNFFKKVDKHRKIKKSSKNVNQRGIRTTGQQKAMKKKGIKMMSQQESEDSNMDENQSNKEDHNSSNSSQNKTKKASTRTGRK